MTPTLAEAIGLRARALRTSRSLTLDDLASRMRFLGFKWTTSRVVELESGKVAPNIATLWALATALGGPVNVVDLVPNEGAIEIQGDEVNAAGLAAWLAGSSGTAAEYLPATLARSIKKEERSTGAAREAARAFSQALGGRDLTLAEMISAEDDRSLATVRAAQGLSIPLVHLGIVAFKLWGHTFSEERETRSNNLPESEQGAIGWVTRRMVKEVRSAIAKGLNSGD